MNLDGMLKEGSLADLTWLENGMKNPGEITFDPVDMGHDHNIKPEAQDQWGYGDISPIFDEEIVGTVDRHIPEDAQGDAGPVILFARHMMNQGASPSVVDRELKARFPKATMKKCASELKELFSMDGIIGRIAIDARGYDNCAQAMTATEKSPYKRFIKFVIGCSCGTPHMIPVEEKGFDVVASTGNAADDFLAEDEPHQVKTIAHCRSTMLPLYSSVDSIDPSWMEDLLMVVESISGVPGDEFSKIKMLDEQPVTKIQKAFKAIDRVREIQGRKRYSEPVNASEYIVDTAENEIELFASSQEEIEIDPVNHAIQQEVVPEPIPQLVESSVDMKAEMTEIELASTAEAQLEGIELSEAGDITLAEKKEAAKPLDVNPEAGDNLAEEFPDLLSAESIDMTMQADGIFRDADVIELEPVKEAKKDLDIDMKPEFEW